MAASQSGLDQFQGCRCRNDHNDHNDHDDHNDDHDDCFSNYLWFAICLGNVESVKSLKPISLNHRRIKLISGISFEIIKTKFQTKKKSL